MVTTTKNNDAKIFRVKGGGRNMKIHKSTFLAPSLLYLAVREEREREECVGGQWPPQWVT